MLSKRDIKLVASLIFFLIAVLISKIDGKKTSQNANQNESETTQSKEYATSHKVTRVIDGDTIELENGQKVRYIGIDTPETVAPNKPDGCFGKDAANKNRELVENKYVRLEKDVNETDRYGRLLRYVYVDNIFVNDYLVRQGYAFAVSYPPDIKMQELLQNAEKEARENNRGLWGMCGIKNRESSESGK